MNFYSKAEPLFSIGSVTEARGANLYEWHCYIGDEIGGLAPDISQAEASLRRAIAARQRQTARAGMEQRRQRAS